MDRCAVSANAPVFEVVPSVHYDTVSQRWYAATTLYVNGVKEQAQMWTQVDFTNVRKAKRFARTLAQQQEDHIKRMVIEELIAAGTLPGGKANA